ncbi:hypothetical protein LOTGIDRAFT_231286 [Lottia gigantea]|uniref:Uncharacterized protein n=1 Tax=Lottia gigantea TaxID=225164 RepID=V4AVD9_LOTGI|nr:hypothetical protein LOTGIDRAFT_231286 [Lottia gigantea]ESO98970.1 hypothetical protein LOTGIDRAFT_231286 [Lottia gigantea]
MADQNKQGPPPPYSAPQGHSYAPPPHQGFTHPQQHGYGSPPQQGFNQPPPPQGYAQPQQGYAHPPQGYAHPPQGYGSPQYGPGPGYYGHQQTSNNVVIVGQPQPTQTVIVNQRQGTNHLLHCIISLFCPFWIFVWMILMSTAPPPAYTLPGQPAAPIYPQQPAFPQQLAAPLQHTTFTSHQTFIPQPTYVPQPVSTHTNTVVVAPQPAQNTVIINKRREGADHALHAIISIFFPPWVFVWLYFCLTQGL